tara:strand:+ start:1283 stop:1885 length:603 start_codon:yes stop_codon:yes gene_type:complete
MTDTMETATAVNYFDPSQEKTNTRLAQGVYPAHIIKCDSVERPIKGKYKARIYNFRIKIANEVTTRHYQIEDISGIMTDVNSSDYIGREVRSAGIFFFLTPDIGDDFEANSGGNRKFMDTVEALGVPCPEIEVEVGGEKRMVKSLPNLEHSDFLGKPVLASIGLGKPWKGTDGVERQSHEVKSINLWEEGTYVETEKLPF